MNIFACILKIYPDWVGSVRNNSFDGIMPATTETRPIPTLKELEAVWPAVQAEIEAQKKNDEAKAILAEIDLKSIRSIREWIVSQEKAPTFLTDYEKQAQAARQGLIK